MNNIFNSPPTSGHGNNFSAGDSPFSTLRRISDATRTASGGRTRSLIGLGLFLSLVLLGLFVHLRPTQAAGTPNYWTNGGGDNLWSTNTNWSLGHYPSGSETATFNSSHIDDCTIDMAPTITGISIISGYTGHISQGANTITLAGDGYTQADGYFDGGGADVYVGSGGTGANFNLSGGSFTAPSTILHVTGSFTQTNSPAWNANGGTVRFDGSYLGNTSVNAPGISFNRVSIDRTITYNSSSYTFTIGANTNVPLGDSPTVNLKNNQGTAYNLANNGTINASGTFTLNQNITWGSGYATFINNGSINFSAGSTWVSNAHLTNNVDLDLSNLTTWTTSCCNITNAVGKTVNANDITSFTTFNLTNNGTMSFSSEDTFNFGNTLTNNSGASFIPKTGAVVFNVAGSFIVSSSSSSFPTSNITLNLNGSYTGGDSSVDASSVNFTLVTINREMTRGGGNTTTLTIAAGTTIPLGNPATVVLKDNSSWGGSNYSLVNNGTITLGTDTLTIYLVGNYGASTTGTFTNNGSIDFSLASGWTMTGHYINNTTLNADTLTSWTVGGNLTNNTGKTINAGGINSLSVGGTSGGSLTNNGTINAGNATTFTTQASFTNNLNAAFYPKSGAVTLNVGASLTVSPTSAYFPTSDVTLNLNGSYNADSTISAPTVNFTLVTINREMTRGGGLTTYLTIAAGTTIPLGNSPTVSLKEDSSWGGSNYSLVNNGTITVGTGTLTVSTIGYYGLSQTGTFTNNGILDLTSATSWVMNGHYTQNSGKTILTDPNLNLTAWANFTVASYSEFPTTLGTLTISGSSGIQTITLPRVRSYGGLAKTNASTWTPPGNMIITGNISYTGGTIGNPASPITIRVGGNYTQSTGTLAGSNLTIDFNGSGTQTINKSGGTFSSYFKVSGPGAVQLSTAFSTSGTTCIVSGGTFDINGYIFSCGSTFTVQNGGTLTMVGKEPLTTPPTLDPGSTVIYKGNGDGQADSYQIKNWSYSNLTVNMTGGDSLNPTSDITDGLVAYWPMNETSGINVDETIGNNDGTATGTQIVDGVISKARSFNGTSSDYISLPGFYIGATNNVSFSAWVKTNSVGTRQTIFSQNNTAGALQVEVGSCNGSSGAVCTMISGIWISQANSVIDTGWHHLVYTRNGAGANHHIYVDGIEQALTINATNSYVDTNSIKYFAERVNNQWFNGYLDDVRLYNRTLTPTEVTTLSNYTGPEVASLTISGNLTVSSGTFVAPATLTIGGNFTNNDIFTNNGGTVVFADASQPSVVSGSGAISFSNLSVTTPLKQLIFASGKAVSITGVLTLTGAYGYPVQINATSSTQWLVNKSGSSSVTYANIANSGCDSGTADITLDGTNQNGGNNGPCWVFSDSQSTLNIQGIQMEGININ